MQILQPCIIHLLLRLCTFPLISCKGENVHFWWDDLLPTKVGPSSLYDKHYFHSFDFSKLISFPFTPEQGKMMGKKGYHYHQCQIFEGCSSAGKVPWWLFDVMNMELASSINTIAFFEWHKPYPQNELRSLLGFVRYALCTSSAMVFSDTEWSKDNTAAAGITIMVMGISCNLPK